MPHPLSTALARLPLRLLLLLVPAGIMAAPAPGLARKAPKAELPDGLELVVAAAPPLVTFPIMGGFDDRGRLFVGDAAGVNLDRAGLEQRLPNRVLRLEDTDGDGVFDRRSVFADRMTFPQGAAWLDGSLYVASPPGIWKLTDADDDGVAERREMIVGGFDFDGNAADVHGPFVHPFNGRLYWCHGRKGHRVVQPDGTLVHEGKASGIWSCNPDGSDVQWHALGSMDNPVEVDFTPEGDIIGVVNLHYNQPRADTLVHWVYRGVFERPDQLAVLEGLPRTREKMPIIHDYGHVAVSGSTFYRSGALNPAWLGDMLVTFFNTQKLVRTKLTPSGATFVATEHALLKIDDPDVHLTDVIEDADGSLLVLDTGGWFRRGCPTSLVEKPDLRGAIYRLRRRGAAPVADPYGLKIAWDELTRAGLARLASDPRWRVREKAAAWSRALEKPGAADTSASALLDPARPRARLHALEALARSGRIDDAQREALRATLAEPLDPVLDHAAIFAAIATRAFQVGDLAGAASPELVRRLLVALDQGALTDEARAALLGFARTRVDADEPELARTAVRVVARSIQSIDAARPGFLEELAAPAVPRGMLRVIVEVTAAHLAEPAAQGVITRMLRHESREVRAAAWAILAEHPRTFRHPDWLEPVARSLEEAMASERFGELALLLEVTGRLDPKRFAPQVRAIVNDGDRAQPVRLKALGALFRPGDGLDRDAFSLLLAFAQDEDSPTARIDAARMLARARLTPAQLGTMAPLLATVGPVELSELLKLGKRLDPESARIWAGHLVRSPVFDVLDESAIKVAFSAVPAEIYEELVAPAVRAAVAAVDARKRRVEVLAAAAERGRAVAGRELFAASACAACHKVGEMGRALGPDLSRIGRIRQPRDLLESILLPNATIARDYETRVIETIDGQSHTGMIRRNAPDGLVLVDLAGQEQIIPHEQIAGNTELATSLMPPGLEQAFTEQELLDLVAWLGSLK